MNFFPGYSGFIGAYHTNTTKQLGNCKKKLVGTDYKCQHSRAESVIEFLCAVISRDCFEED